ncbi:MAG: histidinol-phosphatase HisJ family protein [Mitsuokella sp.]
MLFDSHMHTRFSADSEMKAKDAVEKAASEGIGIVFTEHLDYDFPSEADFTFDPEAYWKEYEPIRSHTLRLGVEVGMRASTEKRSRAFIARVPFDLIIGSLHILGGRDLYDAEAYEGKERADVYRQYLAKMEAGIRSHDFINVLGHIDYIARYAPYENPDLTYGEFRPEIDRVLRAVIQTGIVLELNTRRLGDRHAIKELVPIYQRYYDLGGRYVTIGADAHRAMDVGKYFREAEEIADQTNLQIVTYVERRMERCWRP